MGNRLGDASCANSNWHILVGMGTDEKDKQLGKLLKEQRLKHERRGDPILQREIGEAVGMTQSQISRVEKGDRSVLRMPGEQLYKLFSAYRFDTLKIKGIVQEFNLARPPQLPHEGPDDPPPGTVDVLYEGTVTTEVKPPELRRIQAAFIEGLEPDVVRLRDVQANDLVTPGAAREVVPHSYLVLEISNTADPGDLAVYQLPNGTCFLGVVGENEPWARPLSGPGEPVSTAGAKMIRVVDGEYKRKRRRRLLNGQV